MKHYIQGLFPWFVAACISGTMPSCVDNDYDLTKDIDLTINVGGDLSVPSSSTDRYTMAQILDLSETSSIKPIGASYGLAEGDYVLVQDGVANVPSFSIARQCMTDLSCNHASADIAFVGAPGSSVNVTLPAISNSISIKESDINPDLISLAKVLCDVPMNIRIEPEATGSFSGTVTFQPGFAITYPKGWTMAVTDANASTFCRAEGNKIIFTAPRQLAIGSQLDLPLTIAAVDFTVLPEGQGLYAPGKFRLEDVMVTGGDVSLAVDGLAAGQAASLRMQITPSISSAEILQVTGAIDPKITVDDSSIAVNDIPDFLKEPGNNLDIENPRLYFTVSNDSPVEINLDARLTSIDDNGTVNEVWFGSAHGTDPVVIKANTVTEICISRTGEGGRPGCVDIAVPDLSSIIATIPERLVIDNIEAKVPTDREFTFDLGRDYAATVDYEAVIPLAFGPDLQFVYTTDEKGWDEDLDKYSFKKALVTVTIENTVPLDMVPEVVALDRQGNPIDDIVATVEGTVAGGTIASPTNTALKVTLSSTADNIGNLDGVRFTFRATCPAELTGVALNEAQALRFTNIRLRILGGVGVDLN